MKIAILSDSHDNIPNLKKALKICQKEDITEIIHCGDLTKTESLIESWPKELKAIVHFVYGNADQEKEIKEKEKIFPNLKIHGKIGYITKNNKKIAFTHYPEIAKELAQQNKYDYIFYGHDHKPWQEKIKKTIMINPGNIANFAFKPTFAIWDLEKNKFSLKILDREK